MTTEQIRKAMAATPFKPFVIETAGGREYPVPHPEFLYITPPGRTIIVSDRDGAVDILDLLLIESLHFANGKHKNGRSRR